MDVRLVQLLGSFIGAHGHYALARLEYAMEHAAMPAPPLISRLSDASPRTLHTEWPSVERELEDALTFLRHAERDRRSRPNEDTAFRTLERSVRELDQYARAIRWVLSVTESEDV